MPPTNETKRFRRRSAMIVPCTISELNPGFKWWPKTPLPSKPLFISSLPTYLDNLSKFVYAFFSNVANGQTDKNWHTNAGDNISSSLADVMRYLKSGKVSRFLANIKIIREKSLSRWIYGWRISIYENSSKRHEWPQAKDDSIACIVIFN